MGMQHSTHIPVIEHALTMTTQFKLASAEDYKARILYLCVAGAGSY
jgi:hypothetical protein